MHCSLNDFTIPPTWERSRDLLVKSELLYQLSYGRSPLFYNAQKFEYQLFARSICGLQRQVKRKRARACYEKRDAHHEREPERAFWERAVGACE